MDEFEFLRNMYRRLSEAERFLQNEKQELSAAGSKKKDFKNDSVVAMVKCTIRDYLELRASK